MQDEQNRATAQYALNQMKESVLEKHRTRLRNVLEPQWYIPNLKALIRKRAGLPAKEEDEDYSEGIIPALERSANILQLDPEAIELPFKPKVVFKDKSFDTFLEKTKALLGWVSLNGLTIPMALEEAGLDRWVGPMEQEIAAKEAKAQITAMPLPQTPGAIETPDNIMTDINTSTDLPHLPISLGGSSVDSSKDKKRKTKQA